MSDGFGPWRIEAELAAGGLGDVVVARKGGGPRVAVKRLFAHHARTPEVRALFAGECKLAIELAPHPNLVRGLEHGEDEERPWLALGLASGADLRRRIGAGQHPDRAGAIDIVIAAAAAAAHLHAAGYVHGDIHPANLVVDDGGGVVLCDLGVARAIGASGAAGTHAHMAPEQVKGEPWSPAVDVFALGILLWELTAKRRLFYRGTTWGTLAAVVEDEAPAVEDRQLNPIAQRALAKQPAARFASAAELTDALRDVAGP